MSDAPHGIDGKEAAARAGATLCKPGYPNFLPVAEEIHSYHMPAMGLRPI